MRRTGSVGAGRLVALWPLVPFLGFGFCGAWFALANGTVWLSAAESNGGALTNLTVVANVVTGLVLLAAFGLRRLLGERFERALMGRGAALAAGAVGSAGSLLLILPGPAFLQQLFSGATFVLFQVASAMLGVSFGVLFLRPGVLYGSLPLRRAILYLCYSYLVAVFIYLAVQVSPRWSPAAGSPSLALIVAFTGLPLLAAASLCVDPAPIPWFDSRPAVAERPALPQDPGRAPARPLLRGAPPLWAGAVGRELERLQRRTAVGHVGHLQPGHARPRAAAARLCRAGVHPRGAPA